MHTASVGPQKLSFAPDSYTHWLRLGQVLSPYTRNLHTWTSFLCGGANFKTNQKSKGVSFRILLEIQECLWRMCNITHSISLSHFRKETGLKTWTFHIKKYNYFDLSFWDIISWLGYLCLQLSKIALANEMDDITHSPYSRVSNIYIYPSVHSKPILHHTLYTFSGVWTWQTRQPD